MNSEIARSLPSFSSSGDPVDAGPVDTILITSESVPGVEAEGGQAMALNVVSLETDKLGRAGIDVPSAPTPKSALDAEVGGDIAECNRVNGSENMFAQSDVKVRTALVPAYGPFRRANADAAYCRALAERLLATAGGKRKPSEKKPWCLAARLALRPETDDETARTYEAAYYLQHAAILDLPIADFGAWIIDQKQKNSRDFVRANRAATRGNAARQAKYPNIARAKKMKNDSDVADILKSAFDLVESGLGKFFAQRDAIDA